MSNARKIAANALLRVERDKAYSNIVINEEIKVNVLKVADMLKEKGVKLIKLRLMVS